MNLFDQTDAPIVIDETKDYFSEFVGEDKKFKTPQELAKSKAHADAHIANLEKNLNGLRNELATRKTAEDLINQIALRTNPPAERQLEQDPPERTMNTSETKSLTSEDVERMFAEREQTSQRQRNLNETTRKLTEVHGENAAKVVQEKSKELGVDTAYLQKLAEETPSIFLSLFPKPEKSNEVFQAPPANQFRSQVDQVLGEKWSDFNKVKIADPVKYRSASFQRALMEAAQRASDKGLYDKFMSS